MKRDDSIHPRDAAMPHRTFFSIASVLTAVLASATSANAATTPSPAPAAAASGAYKNGDRLSTKPPARAGGARQIEWDHLMPADWDPMKGVQVLSLASMEDGDPRAIEALDRLKRAWNEAPVVPAMDKQRVVIAGFAVPLDAEGTSVHELLLVPYFGACIHTPPPPANQVIHVILPKPAKGMRMMDTVWVTGTLHVATADTSLGPSGYQLDGESVAPYRGGTHP